MFSGKMSWCLKFTFKELRGKYVLRAACVRVCMYMPLWGESTCMTLFKTNGSDRPISVCFTNVYCFVALKFSA